MNLSSRGTINLKLKVNQFRQEINLNRILILYFALNSQLCIMNIINKIVDIVN